MNIAITGSHGFIGNNLCTYLDKLEDINLITINRTPLRNKSQKEYSFHELFNGEIKEEIDIFIHLASPNHDNERNNNLENGIYNLTKNILNVLDHYNCKKFIFFSSAKVYGESSFKNISYNENSRTKPKTDYAKIKLRTEKLIIKESDRIKFNYIIYRPSFVYGFGMTSNLGKIFTVIDNSLPMIVMDKSLEMKKSFLSVNNINRVIKMNIYNKEKISNIIFNLCDEQPISLSQVINLYKNKIHSKSILIKINKITFYVLKKIPIFNKLIKKIFGSFNIDNSKIKKFYAEKLISTSDGLDEYLKNRI